MTDNEPLVLINARQQPGYVDTALHRAVSPRGRTGARAPAGSGGVTQRYLMLSLR